MSRSKTGEVAKNYKMLANPVFITPGIYIYKSNQIASYVIYIYIYIYIYNITGDLI